MINVAFTQQPALYKKIHNCVLKPNICSALTELSMSIKKSKFR